MKLKFFIGLISVVIFLDQLSKEIILNFIDVYESIKVIPGFFDLVLVYNPGVAFGLMSTWTDSLRIMVISSVSVLAIIVLLYLYWTHYKSSFFSSLAIAFIFGGAVGNIIDRVRHGEVVDFLDFYIGNMHWPAFNFADSFICVGVFLLLIMKEPEKEVVPKV